jgi:hypothetical protein
VVLDPDATENQKAGARAAVELWNRGASTRLSVREASEATADGAATSPAPTELPLHFRQAAAPSHGYFDPLTGQILINLNLTAHALAVTVAHELGHAFGLVHVSNRQSVMAPGNVDVEPTEGDIAELSKLWGTCVDPDAATP